MDPVNSYNPSSHAADTIEQTAKRWAIVAGIAIVAFLVGWSVLNYVRTQNERKVGQTWSEFAKVESPFGIVGSGASNPDSLSEAQRPWARLITANKPLSSSQITPSGLQEAAPLFSGLETSAAGTPVVNGLIPNVMGSKAVVASIDAFNAWEASNGHLLQNPPPAATDRVRITTDLGVIEIGLYPDKAPEHVKNFLELVRSGFYKKTKFHRVTKQGIFVIQGGDPNSIDGDPNTWGQGTKGDGVPFERNALLHFRGAVAMAQPGAQIGPKKSSGCQFYIVTKDSSSLNGNYTVFGTVINGMDIVDKIAASELVPGSERPSTPTSIFNTEVY